MSTNHRVTNRNPATAVVRAARSTGRRLRRALPGTLTQRRPWRRGPWYALVALSFVVSPAQALTDEEITRLETLSGIGTEACEKRDYETCLRMFTQANALLDFAPHHFYVGEALVGSGRMLEGIATWQKLVAAHETSEDPMVQQFVLAARGRLDTELQQLPSLLLDISLEHKGLIEVRIDGQKQETAQLSEPIRLDPGRHVVEFGQRGYLREREQIELVRGEQRTLRVTLEPQPVPRSQPEPRPERPTQDVAPPDERAWVFPLGVSLAGVGVAASVTGAIAFSIKDLRVDDLERACGGGGECEGLSPAEFYRRNERIEERTLVANVLIFGGVGLIAAGGGLLVWDLASSGPDPSADQAERAALGVRVGAGSVALGGRF